MQNSFLNNETDHIAVAEAIINALREKNLNVREVLNVPSVSGQEISKREILDVLEALQHLKVVGHSWEGRKKVYTIIKDGIDFQDLDLSHVYTFFYEEVEYEKEIIISSSSTLIPTKIGVEFKRDDKNPIILNLSDEMQALWLLLDSFPISLMGYQPNEVRKIKEIDTTEWSKSRINPSNTIVVYEGNPLGIGESFNGFGRRVRIANPEKRIKMYDFVILEELEEIKPLEKATLLATYDIKKAIKGVAPLHAGDEDVKEIVLYALALYDRTNAKKTGVPIILLADSGEGKTSMAENLSMVFGADIRSKNAITEAGLGLINGEGSIKSTSLSGMTIFDELDKWNAEYLDTLLTIFGFEKSKRTRYGEDFVALPVTLPVGLLLKDWESYLSSRHADKKGQVMSQILRRGVFMELSGKDVASDREHMAMVMEQEEGRELENCWAESFNNYVMHTATCLKKARELREKDNVTLRRDDYDRLKDYIMHVSNKFRLPLASPRKAVRPLIIRLAKGKALVEGRAEANFEDVKYIANILIKHAKKLGYYETEAKAEEDGNEDVTEIDNDDIGIEGWRDNSSLEALIYDTVIKATEQSRVVIDDPAWEAILKVLSRENRQMSESEIWHSLGREKGSRYRDALKQMVNRGVILRRESENGYLYKKAKQPSKGALIDMVVNRIAQQHGIPKAEVQRKIDELIRDGNLGVERDELGNAYVKVM